MPDWSNFCFAKKMCLLICSTDAEWIHSPHVQNKPVSTPSALISNIKAEGLCLPLSYDSKLTLKGAEFCPSEEHRQMVLLLNS